MATGGLALATALLLALGPALAAERLRGLLLGLGLVACVLVTASTVLARVGLAGWAQALLGIEYLGALSVRHEVLWWEPAAAGSLLLVVGELIAWSADASLSRRDEVAVHLGRAARVGALLLAAAGFAAIPLLAAGGPTLAGPLPAVAGAAAVVGVTLLVAVLARR
jgi:hypothetical protein